MMASRAQIIYRERTSPFDGHFLDNVLYALHDGHVSCAPCGYPFVTVGVPLLFVKYDGVSVDESVH